MTLHYEIVHSCHGRVFDLESYDRTEALRRVMAGRDPGYYLLVAQEHVPAGIDGVTIFGPFGHARHAQAAADELAREQDRLPLVARERPATRHGV